MTVRLLAFLTVLTLFVVGCQEIGYPTPSGGSSSTTPSSGRRTLILSEDRAVLAVQDYLLSKAVSAKAKTYLTDLYSSGAQWTAKSDLLKDGTRIYNVLITVDRADAQVKPYWRKAGWTVFEDGKVLPSVEYEASALRIEADLQGLGSS